ncbi:MAG: carboxypeptidase regulatory-like domain-containing protein [Candidatus Acidiferrales bacterium]
MRTSSSTTIRIAGFLSVLLALCAIQLRAQDATKAATAVVSGKVQDARNQPVAAATVALEGADAAHTLTSTADAKGQFRFEGVPAGNYTVRAKLPGYEDCVKGPFALHAQENKSIVLFLAKQNSPASAKDASSGMAFSDEPAFTVAGVTDTTALGGHGSGPIVRNSNALSKETASLARENATSSVSAAPSQEGAIRAALAKEDNADLRAQLAEIEESQGHPVDAVLDYQRAAEMQPTEPHLFAWGAELLLHHAPEPAIEVFTKGDRLYPQSSRMLLGLGASWYAQRSKDEAQQIFFEACDLSPADPTPYLFLGRLQAIEQVVPVAWIDRMKRFASLHPEMAMAHYLYGAALLKQGAHPDHSDIAESELKTALKLDPHLGNAYLQLGILLTDREDFPGAIAALQKAIENTPIPDDAHYRLAQIYRRTGETEKARQEIAIFKQLSEKKHEDAERERHEIPQFVYTLRGQAPAAPPATPDSH